MGPDRCGLGAESDLSLCPGLVGSGLSAWHSRPRFWDIVVVGGWEVVDQQTVESTHWEPTCCRI